MMHSGQVKRIYGFMDVRPLLLEDSDNNIQDVEDLEPVL